MVKKITLGIVTLVIAYLGFQFFAEYFALHPYYEQFMAGDTGKQTLQILFLGIACALIPVSYLLTSKRKSFWATFLLLWLGLWLFQTSYIGIKAELLGAAVIKTLVNTGFILGLGTLFCSILIAIGLFISNRVLKIDADTTIMKFLLAFGLGLIAFLSLEYIVLLLNIAFPLVNRLLLLGGAYRARHNREELHDLRHDLQQELWPKESLFSHRVATLIFGLVLVPFVFSLFSVGSTSRAWIVALIAGGLIGNWVYAVSKDGKLGIEGVFTTQGVLQISLFLLLLVSVWYFYNGFVLSYIPYPTAWDANHAYMFLPKMFALNNGYYWSEPSMRGFGGIWLSYITYRFSLFSRSDGFLGISADTIAIEMNFLSGIFVLIFGIGLVHTLLSYLSLTMKDKENTQLLHGLTLFGRFLLLLRNTSGMGAFLVFIDNKTDMGVLAMVILALLNGFFFLRYLASVSSDQVSEKKLYTWLGLSGLFLPLPL